MKSKRDYRYDIVLSKKYISRGPAQKHIIIYIHNGRVIFMNPLLHFLLSKNVKVRLAEYTYATIST